MSQIFKNKVRQHLGANDAVKSYCYGRILLRLTAKEFSEQVSAKTEIAVMNLNLAFFFLTKAGYLQFLNISQADKFEFTNYMHFTKFNIPSTSNSTSQIAFPASLLATHLYTPSSSRSAKLITS